MVGLGGISRMAGGSLPKTNLNGEWGKTTPGKLLISKIAQGKTEDQAFLCSAKEIRSVLTTALKATSALPFHRSRIPSKPQSV